MAKGENYTIIKLSGRTEFFPDADYYSVLSNVFHEYMSAGSNWDRPNMLLFNGRVVMTEGLADLAWNYGERNRALHEEIHTKIRAEFAPEWLKDTSDAQG